MLLGDYNLTGVLSSINDVLSYNLDDASTDVSRKASTLGNSMWILELQQHHPVLVVYKGYTLDLCFSNFTQVLSEKPVEILSTVDEHHPPVLYKVPILCDDRLSVNVKYKNFRKADY